MWKFQKNAIFSRNPALIGSVTIENRDMREETLEPSITAGIEAVETERTMLRAPDVDSGPGCSGAEPAGG